MPIPIPKFAAAILCLPLLSFKPGPPSLSWTVQASGTTESLRGLSAVDEKTAWASGTKGTVLRTTDGGAVWTILPIPGAGNIDFRDIEGFDSETAVAMGVGSPAKIYRTEDGGRTWALVYENDAPGIFLDAMAFFDGQNGLAAGDPMDGRFVLLATADGGKSWTPLPPESRPVAAEGEAAFAASGTSLFLSGDGRAWFCTGGIVSRIWRSSDRGRSWEAAPSALREGLSSTGGFSVFFFNALSGIAVGGDYRDEASMAENASVSKDGGKTWTPVSGSSPGGFREAVAAGPGALSPIAVAVGPSGSDFSVDLGKTWAPIPGFAGFHTISFAKRGGAAWAAGRQGLVARLNLRLS